MSSSKLTNPPMFHEATVRFTNEFIDSLPISLANHAAEIYERYNLSVQASDDVCYVCVGHVKQIALFIDELPKYVKEIKLKRALEESSCIPSVTEGSSGGGIDSLACLECPALDCAYVTKSHSEFKNHIHSHRRTARKDGLVVQFSYACSLCDEKAFTTTYLSCYLRHVESVHTNKKGVLCELCGQSFTRADNLTSHKLTVHSQEASPAKPHTCSHCQKSFRLKAHLLEHIKIHDDSKNFACDICDKKFKKASYKNKHISYSHKREKSFICGKCNQSFSTNQRLKTHIQSMHSVKVNSESMVNEITQRVVEHIRNEAAEAAESVESCRIHMQVDQNPPSRLELSESQPHVMAIGMSIESAIPEAGSNHNQPYLEQTTNQEGKPDSIESMLCLEPMVSRDEGSQSGLVEARVCGQFSQSDFPPSVSSGLESQPGQLTSMACSSDFSQIEQYTTSMAAKDGSFISEMPQNEAINEADQANDLDQLLGINSSPPSEPQSICSQQPSRPPSVSSQTYHLPQSQPASISSVHSQSIESQVNNNNFPSQNEQPPPSYEQSLREQVTFSQTGAFHPIGSIGSDVLTSSFQGMCSHSDIEDPLNELLNTPINQHGQANIISHTSSSCTSANTSSVFVTSNIEPSYSDDRFIDGLNSSTSTGGGHPNVMGDRYTPVLQLESLEDGQEALQSRLLATNVDAFNQLHTPHKEFPPHVDFTNESHVFNPDLPISNLSSGAQMLPHSISHSTSG